MGNNQSAMGPFVGRDRIKEDVAIYVDGIALREDRIFILKRTHTNTHTQFV